MSREGHGLFVQGKPLQVSGTGVKVTKEAELAVMLPVWAQRAEAPPQHQERTGGCITGRRLTVFFMAVVPGG